MRHVLMAMAFALASSPALAQDPKGFYLGLGGGKSDFTEACDGAPSFINCDDGDTATRIFGGYQFNRHLAVEGGYTDLGKARFTATGVPGSVDFNATGIEVTAVGILPLGPRWALFGKAGIFFWDLDVKDGTGTVGNTSESGADLTIGAGVSFEFTRNISARLEYQLYSDIGDEDTTGVSDATVLGASVVFKF